MIFTLYFAIIAESNHFVTNKIIRGDQNNLYLWGKQLCKEHRLMSFEA